MSSSINQRFKRLVGSTRRSSSNSVAGSQSSNAGSTTNLAAPTQRVSPSRGGVSPSPLTLPNGSAPTSNPAAAPSDDTTGTAVAAAAAAAAAAATSTAASPSSTPPPSGVTRNSAQLTATPNGSATQQPASSASSTSLAMNPNQQPTPLGRPPSYQYANQGGTLGAPGHPSQGRPSSPMPPPPINTGAGHAYAPQHQQQLYTQPAPPGYPMGQPPQGHQPYGYGPQAVQGPHSYNRGPAEVQGDNSRSKAQLIVGIDFVSRLPPAPWGTRLTMDVGDHILGCRIRVCYQH